MTSALTLSCLFLAIGVSAAVYVGSGNDGSGSGTGSGTGGSYSSGTYYSYPGTWSQWATYSSCSVTCGQGSYRRTRICVRPQYLTGGTYLGCEGDVTSDRRPCFMGSCAINGYWSEWSAYTACHQNGMKTRTRSCSNPAPSNGGIPCPGENTETIVCPVHGGWTPWTSYSSCDSYGRKTRTRACSNPAPYNGGLPCDGSSSETANCPVHGGFTQWSTYGECTASCGGGSQTRTRTCNAPAPLYGGDLCNGEEEQVIRCNEDVYCPVDGRYGEWGEWSVCSGTCGTGQRERSRACTSPVPAYGGQQCQGNAMETETCQHSNQCETNNCQDGHEYCGYWSGIGECRTNPLYMRTTCKVSCNMCNDGY